VAVSLSPDGVNLHATPGPVEELLVATQRGIVTFQRAASGAAWREVCPSLSMNAHANGFALFAGPTDGDAFFSDDQGERWDSVARGLLPVSKSGHHGALAMAAPSAS